MTDIQGEINRTKFQSLIVFSNTLREKNRQKTLQWFQSLIVFSNTKQKGARGERELSFQSLIVFSNTYEILKQNGVLPCFNHL